MVTGIRVEGGRELRTSLRKAAGDLNDLKATHKKVADFVVDRAEPNAPRGETGALAASGRAAGTATAAIIRYGGAKVRYAGVQHFGWPDHNIDPHPWVTETAQETEPAWVDMYAEGVQSVLNRIKGI